MMRESDLSEKLNIRQEAPGDYAGVYALTKAAFDGTEHCDGDEQELPGRLRGRVEFIPKLSLVAELGGRLVGHIMFSPITIGGHSALCMGPVSVLPEFQSRGVGSALIEKGHAVARSLGFSVCVLVGHENYYPRFGYEPISRHGITFPFEAPEDCKMVKFLSEDGKDVRGAAVFPPELEPPKEQFTEEQLQESLQAIASLLGKCEKAQEKLEAGAAQHTLMMNRIRALQISKSLIEKAMGEGAGE
ncbi:MAG: N-acetyltransferase [Oscillospiraceae bacterium]|nr:N-acetyltransferase [Oscillospiraceae bacterium]